MSLTPTPSTVSELYLGFEPAIVNSVPDASTVASGLERTMSLRSRLTVAALRMSSAVNTELEPELAK